MEPPAQTSGMERPVIWEGETWDACPFCCMYCAPLCCQTTYYKITDARIDRTGGCCKSSEDTLDLRRITDVGFKTNCCTETFCCGWGTIEITSADASDPNMTISTCGTREIYKGLREAWSNAKVGTVAQVDQY